MRPEKKAGCPPRTPIPPALTGRLGGDNSSRRCGARVFPSPAPPRGRGTGPGRTPPPWFQRGQGRCPGLRGGATPVSLKTEHGAREEGSGASRSPGVCPARLRTCLGPASPFWVWMEMSVLCLACHCALETHKLSGLKVRSRRGILLQEESSLRSHPPLT